MAQDSLISIVLPTYNGSPYLREAIQSCLDQSHENWELIVVDDASTDETPTIIAAFAAQDARIRTIRNPVNRMLPGSLNVGFAAAQGKLLTWTSDDNLYRPHALAEMAAVLEENPDIDFVYSDMTVIDEEGQPLGPADWVASLDHLARACCIGASFLYRRSVMERVGRYDESLPLVEDYDFWMRVSWQARMHYLPKDLYLYRTHGRSLTATRHEAAVLAVIRCQAKNMPDLHWVRRSERALVLMEAGWWARCRGDRKLAWACLWRSIRLHPLAPPVSKPKLFGAFFLPDRLIRRWTPRSGGAAPADPGSRA